ncbi:pyridoxamine 5'-phosphate oxidase family protein [Brenneria goodwinii]|uniref:pyridoxamine 5'-phosphate oxidase family protein n=1 Tax=Brenneria goodwinii TaxID=1109412 RepID=UPI000EF1DEF3|nr:pyridoxamine 5'-phosphate oxidase family protein [Brenneria goodwinii]MCG8156609.1 pyridoxamine 5'-phosphate oxidase family protein [Brenneria goodwinii]MCG8159677.1 pyridoxamine 5'-phosphate oxidase family protein [Brenneria goodwinii]MCG8165767.1 pyridoxamine 5'-phosphate oxidase family protein [Brenneria goodwinii]MCG8170272.1 pyridoxamine 5'-phosphate oxidase family protein [Brenneria goodwinii]MCG8173536.1 pyridoxamine 5'-phosphate oxidase family protein [Brenneria goodwinii]
MDFLPQFNRLMTEQRDLALATSIENAPNVRIVNFYCDTSKKGIVYFSTFRDNQKVKEFKQNNRVAFTTIPLSENQHVRVMNAIVKKSDLTIYDLSEFLLKKNPGYQKIIDHAGDEIELYEIHFSQARVTLDFTCTGIVSF